MAFFLSGTGAKGAKDAVSGRGGDVSATGNVPEMSWAPVPWLPCFKSVFVVSQTREEEFKQRPWRKAVRAEMKVKYFTYLPARAYPGLDVHLSRQKDKLDFINGLTLEICSKC